jgi:outer membrane protein OmpA-like peptidoglycan-associated protein
MTRTRTIITFTVFIAVAVATASFAIAAAGSLLAPAQIPRSVALLSPPGRGLDKPWWESITVKRSRPNPNVVTFVVPSDVVFATESATVSETGRLDLVGLTRTRLVNATKIVVAGATDGRGTRTDNLRLSRERADAAAAVLIAAGGDPRIIHTQAWADDHPVADEHGLDPATAQARNRRVEIEVTK